MHDLGKIAVDDAVLRKPGRFTDEEYNEMKKHAAEGARIVHEILKDTDDDAFHQLAENVAHYHHERYDGHGYPDGLVGDDIPFEARIMAIADVYDALVSKRVYKESMSFEDADKIIMEGMGTHFDPALASAYKNARPRLEEYYRQVPIVFTTTADINEVFKGFLEAGFNDYLEKPVSRRTLNSVLTRWLWVRLEEEGDESGSKDNMFSARYNELNILIDDAEKVYLSHKTEMLSYCVKGIEKISKRLGLSDISALSSELEEAIWFEDDDRVGQLFNKLRTGVRDAITIR